ncbi:MAG: hypothetical protein ACXIVQ_01800 [Acidimicrobiales bacterium]
MPRRIEVELTSEREDGTWTWRAAGARQPKGTLDGSLLYDGAKIGDVVRADAEFEVDGIDIVGVLPPKGPRAQPETIELLSSGPSEDQLVTTTLAPKRRGERRGGDREGGRRPGRREGGGPRGDRGDRGDGGDRPPRSEGGGDNRRPARPPRTERPAPPAKPKPKRLRPLRHHRNAVLESLPEAERPIAEQVLRGGVPAVRQAVDKQNEQAVADGQPAIKAEPLVAMAERLLPRLREAEWRDRADAALANLDELDLRDLRSVVVASDSAARDDETRALATQLRDGLNQRVESEHQAWLTELAETLEAGRTVRALRLSSRPPKAGAPLPPELATRLTEAANAAFGPDVTQERWATVLDAVAYSPVRQQIEPASVPAEPSAELLAAVKKLASRIPAVAARFGIEATEAPRRPRRGGRRGSAGGSAQSPPIPPPPASEGSGAATTPTTDPPAESTATPAPEQPQTAAPEQPETVAPEQPETVAPEQPETVAPEQPEAVAPEQSEADAADLPDVAETAAPVEASAVATEVADAVDDAVESSEAPRMGDDDAPTTPAETEDAAQPDED